MGSGPRWCRPSVAEQRYAELRTQMARLHPQADETDEDKARAAARRKKRLPGPATTPSSRCGTSRLQPTYAELRYAQLRADTAPHVKPTASERRYVELRAQMLRMARGDARELPPLQQDGGGRGAESGGEDEGDEGAPGSEAAEADRGGGGWAEQVQSQRAAASPGSPRSARSGGSEGGREGSPAGAGGDVGNGAQRGTAGSSPAASECGVLGTGDGGSGDEDEGHEDGYEEPCKGVGGEVLAGHDWANDRGKYAGNGGEELGSEDGHQ